MNGGGLLLVFLTYEKTFTIMLKRTLFHELTGADPRVIGRLPIKLTPDSVNYSYLVKGHVMEYYLIGRQAKKMVALFFGPEEYVIKSHAAFSTLECLDDASIESLPYGAIFRALRHPEVAATYREIQMEYRRKVADRIHSMKSMTAPERFAHLKATQPWVFDVVEEEDVANYLGVSVGMLEELGRGSSSQN
jgi:hypothetical protein